MAAIFSKFLDHNEEKQKFRFIVVANYEQNAVLKKKEYKYSQVYYRGDGMFLNVIYNGKDQILYKRKYHSKVLAFKVRAKLFHNIITRKIFRKQLREPDLFFSQCFDLCKKEKADYVIIEGYAHDEYNKIVEYVGKDKVFFNLLKAVKSVPELSDFAYECTTLEEIKYANILTEEWMDEVWSNNCKIVNNNHYKYNDTVYVVRTYSRGKGLLSCYLTFLSHFEKCDKNNYTPIVDMLTHFYPGSHNNAEECNKYNAWEFYFKNTSEIDLKHLEDYKTVVYSGIAYPDNKFFDNTLITRDFLKKWYIIDAKYVKLTNSLEQRYSELYNNLLAGKRVIGTMIREGFICIANYNDGITPNGISIKWHPKQPTVEELCVDLSAKMQEWNCDYIFVVAETTLVIEMLQKRFGEKVLFTDRPRREITNFDLEEFHAAGAKIRQEMGSMVVNNQYYLEEVYLLSKCNCLYSGKCSAAIVAALWNRGEYEQMELLQKGQY